MILVTPCFDFDVGFLDFSHTAKLIDMGYEATIQASDAFTHLTDDKQTSVSRSWTQFGLSTDLQPRRN